MTEAKRRKRHAEAYAAKLREDAGRIGWIIVCSTGTSWYGAYGDEETARARVGKRDGYGDVIRGTVVEV
jgi:hypothetical protein